jgi:hypothetical protein
MKQDLEIQNTDQPQSAQRNAIWTGKEAYSIHVLAAWEESRRHQH